MEKPNFKKMCLMYIQQLTNFPYIEKDFDALTDYQLLCKVIAYLNKIITNENQQNETITALYNAFVELKDYVDNYFENLDVQEEINNKLDEMSVSGELEEIISLYIEKEVEYIFPKAWENQYSQDALIIKGYDKNILIDCGYEGNWDNVLLMISNNMINHFDYFIVSHYDGDHIGNINNLIIHGFIDENTQVYLPIVPSKFTNRVERETRIKTLLTTNNIEYITPTEGYVLEINNDFDIKFGNLNESYMTANYSAYNFTSMVCLIRHKNNYSFYAGDCGAPSYKYLYETNFIKEKIDLYKQGHHGIDTSNNFLLFDKLINPTFTVQVAGINDLIKNNFFCEETTFLVNQGTQYYPTYRQNDYLIFASNGYNLYNKKGLSYSVSGQHISMNLYVDIETTNEIQDGSQTYPFKELMQAIGYIQNYPNGIYTIYLADGNYGYSHETGETNVKNLVSVYMNNNVEVRIVGNTEDNTAVKINGIVINNCNLSLNSVTISAKNRDGITAKYSNLILNNCIITDEDETATHTGIIGINSKISIYDSSISYVGSGVSVQYGTLLSYYNVTFSNITNKNVLMRYDEGSGFANGKALISSAASNFPVSLNDDPRQFKYLLISYQTNDGINNSIILVDPAYNMKATIKASYINTGGSTYDKQGIITLNSSNEIEIGTCWQTLIPPSANSTVTKSSIDNPFTIKSVLGIKSY